MMKHVQLSPYRSRADTVSLSSNASFASLSPEPFTASRSSSYTSLNDQHPHQGQQQGQHNTTNKTTIKVYARCLRADIEYKTLSISYETTCRQVVDTLLGKYRMRHRDPRLFYLSMEVTVRNTQQLQRTQIALDDDARPAVLQSCHPRGDSRFSLRTRRGGLVKVHDSLLNSHSHYKSLLISTSTTSDELVALLLACYYNKSTACRLELDVEQYSLYEVCPASEQQRKLHPDDKPLLLQQTWPSANSCHFLIKRNPDYRPFLTRRKFPLTTTTTPTTSTTPTSTTPTSTSSSSINHYINHRNQFKEKRNYADFDLDVDFGGLSHSSYADYENYFYI